MVKWLSIVSLLLISGWALSQNGNMNGRKNEDFNKEWATVDSLEEEGLYRQALEKVNYIFDQACAQGIHAQIIKSTLFNLKYNSNLEEEDVVNSIMRLETSIKQAPSPSKELLHSLTGQVVWNYYNQHRWQFENRTYVADGENLDIRTWDLKRIVERIVYHYSLSLENAQALSSFQLTDFKEILVDDFSSEAMQMRPTIYHFLAYRAIEFYRTASFNIPGAAETQAVDNAAFFGTSNDFLKVSVSGYKDALNPTFKALEIFQALTRFHLGDKSNQAKFSVELERVLFMQEKALMPNKDELYYAALVRIEAENNQQPFGTEATYYRAKYHADRAENYNFLSDTTHRWEYVEALKLCESAINTFPESIGAKKCAFLKSGILVKSLSLRGVEAIAPKLPSSLFIEYRNVDKLYVKVIPYDHTRKVNNDSLRQFLEETEGVITKSVDLRLPVDYQIHSTEIVLEALKSQFYYVVVCTDPSFKSVGTGFSYLPLWVSNITYQTRRTDEDHEVLVVDRTSGAPIKGAEVSVWHTKYNYLTQSYTEKLFGKYKTNEKGLATFKPASGGNTYSISVKANGEEYAPSSNLYAYRYKENNRKQEVTTLFTDRKIYRPGQAIYFKGIVIEYDGERRTLVKNAKQTVQFLDNNYQEIGTLEVTSNDFGSFEGTFEAPVGVLTGNMIIRTETGSTYFNVEEYKRPKFSVEMLPIQGEFNFSDTIRATGNAKAYAGNGIDGAEVSYRVTRSVSYPRYFYWCAWYGNYEEDEIVSGKTTTKDDGTFELEFPALPDVSIAKERSPMFNYTLYADVTDINGETHSTSTVVSVGYTSLQLGNNISDELSASENFTLRVETTNLSGEKVKAKGNVIIEKLAANTDVLYERFWQVPDLPLLSDTEFKKRFPKTQLAEENEWRSWKSEKQVFNKAFNTAESDSIKLEGLEKWEPGVYRYQATTTDKNGATVRDERYFVVYDPAAKVIPVNEVLWVKPLKDVAEPGEMVEFLIGTAEENVSVMYDFVVKNKIVDSKIIKLSKEQKTLCFEVTENLRGNVFLAFSVVKNNHQFSESRMISVPYTNKELDIEFMSFRNKLLPGQQEEWTIKINNKKGEKENAEMLATLYDASLDALSSPNSFYLSIYNSYYGINSWGAAEGAIVGYGTNHELNWNDYLSFPQFVYPRLNYHNFYLYDYYGYNTYYFSLADSEVSVSGNASAPGRMDYRAESMELEESNLPVMDGVMSTLSTGNATYKVQAIGSKQEVSAVQPRTNFNETAFFFPQLHTDAEGIISIKFTIPESLTKWRFAALAHTKDLKIGTLTEEVVTQKELMVVPNVPRFIREGDAIEISTKVSNVSEKDLTGNVRLELIDPMTDEVISSVFGVTVETKSFEATAGRSTVVSWSLKVPRGISLVKYKIVAAAGNFSDGEENVLPILSNRMLVTESLPMPIRGKGTTRFSFDKLKKSDKSKSLTHHRFSIEFTSNPAWYAIQAMPYMMEFPHECAEQVFTRYYSNTIATHIMNSNPKIREVIERWGTESPEAFLSNLQKNEELKAVLLEETPWVLEAQSEEQSKKNLSILLDMHRMAKEQKKALAKTIKSQSPNGGWPWFPGMKENRYISQHILTGMGHLNRLGMLEIEEDRELSTMIERGIAYLDEMIVRDFANAKKYDPDYRKNKHIGYSEIQYLYARSYFMNLEMNSQTKEAVNYYKQQANSYWKDFSIAGEGMLALAAHRLEMSELATKIVKSLKDRSITHQEFGMYWKEYQDGYYWYQAPIETQALMIELFDEVAKDEMTVEELKIWLLKQKQTTNWKTTKQTTEAVYALLLRGSDLLASDELVQVKVGGRALVYEGTEVGNPYRVNAEPGTGYFKTAWSEDQVKPAMGDVEVTKTTDGVAWGAAYWQYFEDMDKITFAETGLQLNKKLYKVIVTPEGEKLTLVSENNELNVGDKVRVRIELRSDRNLEYVHMKDMRAAGFEPMDVLSTYHYQDGLGYYQATKDVSTNFFFDYIPKGTYVFEYDLRVQHKGDFSNGISTIQCMYAPEFTSHSEGIRVEVK